MNEYHISLAYTVKENHTIQAESLAAAKQKAAFLVEDLLVQHDGGEGWFDVIGPNDEHAEGEIHT